MPRKLPKYRKIRTRHVHKFSPRKQIYSRVVSPRKMVDYTQASVEAEFGVSDWDILDIESTCFSNTAYNAETKTLQLQFKTSGREYLFFNVPPERFEDFMRASSKGRYFNIYIKNVYNYQEL